jgi:hypothetical protein
MTVASKISRVTHKTQYTPAQLSKLRTSYERICPKVTTIKGVCVFVLVSCKKRMEVKGLEPELRGAGDGTDDLETGQLIAKLYLYNYTVDVSTVHYTI